MSAINIEFLWPVAERYELVEPGPDDKSNALAAIREPVIQQIGKSEPRQPLATTADLYLRFAALKNYPEGKPFAEACLRFAHDYGFVQTYGYDGEFETLESWRSAVEFMNETMHGLRRAKNENALPRAGAAITDVGVMLLPGKPEPKVVLRPRVLLDAMRLQLAQSIAGGRGLQACENCGNWFEVGGRRGAKRVGSKFCSDACRNEFHYQQKKAVTS
ncbi:hypothetical protein [Bradyrhizobium sp. USDA 4486]